MANELQLSFQGNASIYAIIRRHSDAWVWNNTLLSFESWDTANLDDYDLPLSDADGDLYQANWPSSMVAGQYRLLYYRLAVGVPADDDLLLATTDMEWNGIAASPVSSIELDDDALTTLESIKRHLRISDVSSDTLLAELINQISGRIQLICDRQFKRQIHHERLANVTNGHIVLKHFPVRAIDRVSTGNQAALTVQYTGSSIRASVAVSGTALLLRTLDANGTLTTHTLEFASYPTISMLVAIIDTLAGWAGTLSEDGPSNELHPMVGADAKSNMIWLNVPNHTDTTYQLDWPTGSLRLGHPFSAGPALVTYEAGYDIIPRDIAQVANELVAQAYHLGRHDTNLQREKLGDHAMTLVSAVSLNDDQLARLRPYMNLQLAGV
ncbi:MAG: hypothetical protein JKX85_03635 [Phycisphaeraceae bacterium]|nr:hypothetical protein [Phycisphaeraceae bacterium]